jgi:acetylornithine deacetylase/succinyl-diaminopimelate desuccinylase-like protein
MNLSGILALGLSATAVILGLSGAWLPARLPSQAPPTQFSAERAWQHVSAIARKPHQAGTEENRRVRAYLVAELSKLGLNARVLPATNNGVKLGNVYAEVAGTEGRRPVVLLVSHYDSVTSGK